MLLSILRGALVWLALTVTAQATRLLGPQTSRALAHTSALQTVACSTGTCLAIAFADASIGSVLLNTTGIALVDDDWASVSPRPLLLTRNFTITGRSLDEPVDLWLNFVGPYVQLAPDVWLTLRAVVLHDWRRGSATQAPGFDLVATIPLNPVAAPVVVLDHAALTWPFCGDNDVRNASAQSLSRPAKIPGQNQYGVLAGDWQPGCRNSTDPVSILYSGNPVTQALVKPAVGPLERCYVQASYFTNFAISGVVVDNATSRPKAAGYLIWILESYSLCNQIADAKCIQDLGPLGCELYIQAQWRQQYQQQSMTRNGSAAAHGGNPSMHVLGPALSAALGGAVLVLLAGLASFLVACKRRQLQQQQQQQQQQHGDAQALQQRKTETAEETVNSVTGSGGGAGALLVHRRSDSCSGGGRELECVASGACSRGSEMGSARQHTDGAANVAGKTFSKPWRYNSGLVSPPEGAGGGGGGGTSSGAATVTSLVMTAGATVGEVQSGPAWPASPSSTSCAVLLVQQQQQQKRLSTARTGGIPYEETAGASAVATPETHPDTAAAFVAAARSVLVTPATPQRSDLAMGVEVIAAASISNRMGRMRLFTSAPTGGGDSGGGSNRLATVPAAGTAVSSTASDATSIQCRMGDIDVCTASLACAYKSDVVSAVSGVQAAALCESRTAKCSDALGVSQDEQNGKQREVTGDSLPCSRPATIDAADVANSEAPEAVAATADNGNQVVLLPRVLGRGAFGRVYEGLFRGQRVAVKILSEAVLETSESQLNIQTAPAPPVLQALTPVLLSVADAIGLPEHGRLGNSGSRISCSGTRGVLQAGLLTPPPPVTDVPDCAQQAEHLQDRLLSSFAREVEVLSRVEHPGIVRLLAACLTPPRACLVMELMETNLEAMLYGTSVLEVAATATAAGRRVDMPNQAGAADTIISGEASKALGVCEGSAHLSKQLQLMKVLKIVVQIARALEYMAPTILHRDLKPANVLVNGADSPDPIVKLSDFGLSRLRAATVATLHPEAGTPAYLAPECFDVETRVVTHHADIYSLGVLCWAMLTGRRPWKDLSIPAVAYKVAVLGERPPLEQVGKQRCPPVLRALIRQMWEHDPLRRPAAAEVVLVLEGMLRAGTASIELYRLPPSIVSNVAIMSGSQHKVSGLGSDIFGGEYPQGGQQQHWGSLVADRWPWQRGSLDAQVIAAVSGGMAELQPLQVQPSRQRLASVPCGSQEFRQQSTHAGQTPTSNNELLAGLNQCTNACISLGGDSGTSSSSSSSGVADEEALARQLEELELDID